MAEDNLSVSPEQVGEHELLVFYANLSAGPGAVIKAPGARMLAALDSTTLGADGFTEALRQNLFMQTAFLEADQIVAYDLGRFGGEVPLLARPDQLIAYVILPARIEFGEDRFDRLLRAACLHALDATAHSGAGVRLVCFGPRSFSVQRDPALPFEHLEIEIRDVLEDGTTRPARGPRVWPSRTLAHVVGLSARAQIIVGEDDFELSAPGTGRMDLTGPNLTVFTSPEQATAWRGYLAETRPAPREVRVREAGSLPARKPEGRYDA